MTRGSEASKQDIGWNHGKKVSSKDNKYKYVQCNYCSKIITGSIWRFKHHLAGISPGGSAGCTSVPGDVKELFKKIIKENEEKKNVQKSNKEFLVSRDSQTQGKKSEEAGYSGRGSTVGGSYGPMDRFIVQGEIDDQHDPQLRQQERTLAPINEKEARDNVCMEIGRFFIENGIAFNVADSSSFTSMLRAVVEYKRPLRPPTPYELSTWILKEEVKKTTAVVDKVKATWPISGVTIMSDGWKDMRGRQLINFLVNSPEGTVFLKSVDASDAIKNADLLFKLYDEVIQEVGPENVIQLVSDNASNYVAAGKLVMEKYKHIYWTPCAAHCINLMLGDLYKKLPQLSHAYLNAKKATNFIYNHGWVLALMRKYTKKDLLRPAATRFGTAYLTLNSFFQSRVPLEQMFTSHAWANSAWAKTSEGKAIRKIVLKDKNFWPGLVYALKVSRPLVGVLRLVDSDIPSMGHLYGAMDRAKEEIAKNLENDESRYKEIWTMIDKRWDTQMHRSLHAAAYYLNPQYFYEPNFSAHGEVQRGLYACMDKMILDPEENRRVELQLDAYRDRAGFFGRNAAIETRHSRSPIAWWKAYGCDVPDLTRFAIRVLGLTCTSSGCERNWSTFNNVHTKKRNRLNQSKCNALVYVMFNNRLTLKRKMRQIKVDRHTPDDVALERDGWESDNEWVVDRHEEESVEENEEEPPLVPPPPPHVEDPEPCPQWHYIIETEIDQQAIMADLEEEDNEDGGRKRKRKGVHATSTPRGGGGSGHAIISTPRGGGGSGHAIISTPRGGGRSGHAITPTSAPRGGGGSGHATSSRDKGKGPAIVEEDIPLVDLDEDRESSSESSFEELMRGPRARHSADPEAETESGDSED